MAKGLPEEFRWLKVALRDADLAARGKKFAPEFGRLRDQIKELAEMIVNVYGVES